MPMWIQGKDIQPGFTLRLAGHRIKVVEVTSYADTDDVTIKAEVGHNGIRGQSYNLKTWQEVEVEQEG